MLTLGGSGGPTIITATLQVLLNVLDFHLDPERAIRSPRIHDQVLSHDGSDRSRRCRRRIRNALAEMGFQVKTVPDARRRRGDRDNGGRIRRRRRSAQRRRGPGLLGGISAIAIPPGSVILTESVPGDCRSRTAFQHCTLDMTASALIARIVRCAHERRRSQRVRRGGWSCTRWNARRCRRTRADGVLLSSGQLRTVGTR